MQSPVKYYLNIDERFSFSSDNPEYGRMIDRIRTVASTDVPVVIVGKPGSGKDLVARAIHTLSGRKGQLVSVNCAALSLHLIESELFGHVKGAFSDAKQDRTGRFSIASDGTLFLDEICHMPAEVQAKLLRVVESGDYCPVGSDQALQSSARIVTAVNLDLGRAIADGRFLPDLYYRLARYIIRVPTLEERREDLPRLIQFLFHKYRSKHGGIEHIDAAFVDELLSHDWPGNVRELESVIEASMLNAIHRNSNKIELRDFDGFPSRAIDSLSQSSPAATVEDWVHLLYNDGKTLKDIEVEIRNAVLTELRRRENGSTGSIARVLKMTEKAVRSTYSRTGLELGSSYKRLRTRSNNLATQPQKRHS